jgi:hypothetical protein
MGFVNFTFDSNGNVPNSFFGTTSNRSGLNGFTWSNFPNKAAGFLIVIKNFTKMFRSQRHFQPPVVGMNAIMATTKVQA